MVCNSYSSDLLRHDTALAFLYECGEGNMLVQDGEGGSDHRGCCLRTWPAGLVRFEIRIIKFCKIKLSGGSALIEVSRN